MLATVPSCALFGIDAFPVTVEVDVSGNALPEYQVVGLPATSVKEGAVRIRAALEQVNRGLPNKRVTVNLAPADRRKQGAAFDLPIAIGVLAADRNVGVGPLDDLLALGELGLDGSLRRVRGALSAALLARAQGRRGILLPEASAGEAAVVDGLEVYAASHLSEVVNALDGTAELPRFRGEPTDVADAPEADLGDMSDVRGQVAARTAIEVAVAGGHNLLLVGPPGIGKTMLARRIPTILPPFSRDEALETTQIHSVLGLAPAGLVRHRPFRAPHHSTSAPALIGGGSPPRPGEISLAHHGVLFVDELPEFARSTLESLRQPLEDREVTIARVTGTVTIPASFLLVASANPCPCGWHGSRDRACTCTHYAIERYRSRLSGPLLDRIDLQVHVPNVELHEMRDGEPGESSAAVRNRVVTARDIQARRLARYGLRRNAEMGPKAMRATCALTAAAEATLERIHRKRIAMTGRGIDKIIKIARTIADLNGETKVDAPHVLEAACYRALDDDPIVSVPSALGWNTSSRSRGSSSPG